jgi:hypothetical protein
MTLKITGPLAPATKSLLRLGVGTRSASVKTM